MGHEQIKHTTLCKSGMSTLKCKTACSAAIANQLHKVSIAVPTGLLRSAHVCKAFTSILRVAADALIGNLGKPTASRLPWLHCHMLTC